MNVSICFKIYRALNTTQKIVTRCIYKRNLSSVKMQCALFSHAALQLSVGNGRLFQETIGERSFELHQQKQRNIGNRCWSARRRKRQRKGENSRRNINGRRESKLKRDRFISSLRRSLFASDVSSFSRRDDRSR